MNAMAARMKMEIRTVAGYRALMISRYFITLLLAIASLYMGFIRYALSPFYILLMLNMLPPVLNFAFKDYSKKNKNNKLLAGLAADTPFQLNMLKQKYKYTRLSYVTNSIAYLSALVLLCLWLYNCNNNESINELVRRFPLYIIAAGISIRFLGRILYQFKLPYDLAHNKL